MTSTSPSNMCHMTTTTSDASIVLFLSTTCTAVIQRKFNKINKRNGLLVLVERSIQLEVVDYCSSIEVSAVGEHDLIVLVLSTSIHRETLKRKYIYSSRLLY